MCTAFQLNGYFGRNLDLETTFGEQVVLTPRHYSFPLKNGTLFKNQYAMIGMATVVENYPLYAEAMNEKGLCMAGLYFPGNARYFPEQANKTNITPYELIPYILGQYQSIQEVKKVIDRFHLLDIPFHEKIAFSTFTLDHCRSKRESDSRINRIRIAGLSRCFSYFNQQSTLFVSSMECP